MSRIVDKIKIEELQKQLENERLISKNYKNDVAYLSKQLQELKNITLGIGEIDLNALQNKLVITDVENIYKDVQTIDITNQQQYNEIINTAKVIFNFTSIESVEKFIEILKIIKDYMETLN